MTWWLVDVVLVLCALLLLRQLCAGLEVYWHGWDCWRWGASWVCHTDYLWGRHFGPVELRRRG